MSTQQGWNRSAASNATTTSLKAGLPLSVKILIGIGLAGVVGGVSVFLAHSGNSQTESMKNKPQRIIKTVQPALQKTPSQPTPPPVTNRVYKLRDGRPSVPLGKMTREERIAWLHDAKVERSLRHGWTNSVGEAIIPRTLYKSATEQALSRIFNTELGDPPPRLPNISSIDGKNLASILDKMSEPDPRDGEYAKKIRESVNSAKQELKKYIESGGDVNQYINHYIGELNQAYVMRQDAQKTFKEIFNTTTDPEELRMAYEKISKTLADKGIKPIKVGPRAIQAMGYEVVNPQRKKK